MSILNIKYILFTRMTVPQISKISSLGHFVQKLKKCQIQQRDIIYSFIYKKGTKFNQVIYISAVNNS